MTLKDFTRLPDSISQRLDNCRFSLERRDYHPERFLHSHILKVCENAMATRDLDLFGAALLHDICKPESGSFKLNGGEFYWSNPDHADQAADLILADDDIKHWLWFNGMDWMTVEGIVRHHMVAKNFSSMRRSTLLKYSQKCGGYWNKLITFTICDKMIK